MAAANPQGREKNVPLSIIHKGPFTAQIPYSQEAEEATVGACMVNPDAFIDCAAFLKADDFYILRLSYIWEALGRIEERGDPIDYLTIQEELRTQGRLNEIGGPAYLTQLTSSMPTSMHAVVYGHMVERAAIRRRLLAAADDIRGLALDEERTVEEVTDESEARLYGVTDRESTRSNDRMAWVMSEYFDELEAILNSDIPLGIPSGLKALDEITLFAHSEVTILAGPPKCGKTSAVDTFAYNMAMLGLKVVIFSTEMTRMQVARRFVAMASGIPNKVLKMGPISPVMFQRIVEALKSLALLDIRIVDEFPSPTPTQIRRKIRQIEREQAVDIVIVDGLYEASSERIREGEREATEIKYILQDVREIARNFRIPILLTHQFSRKAHSRENKRPNLADLGDSTWIERIAHCVIGLYRESYYNHDLDPALDVTEFVVLANRDGDTGAARTKFDKATGRYHDVRTIALNED